MIHDPAAKSIVIEITGDSPDGIWYRFRCPFGDKVASAASTGGARQPVINGLDLVLPSGMERLVLTYS